MSNRTKLSAAIATVFAVIVVGGSVIGTAGAKSESESAGNKLAGTWTVTVRPPSPAPPFSSLQVYTGEGSMVESSFHAARSPQYASWKRTSGREYAATGIFFRFNPGTGAFLGEMRINRTIELAQDGQSLTFRGTATPYDTSGNAAGPPVTSTGSGQRLQVEEQP